MSRNECLAWGVFGLGVALFTTAAVALALRLALDFTTWSYVGAVLFLGVLIMVGAMLYLDTTAETIRQYVTQRTRIALVTSAVCSAPLLIMAAGHLAPQVIALVAVFVPLIASSALTRIRCPRCKGSFDLRTAVALALWGMGGHSRIDYCESCRVPFDEPRNGPRRKPVED